MLAVIYTLCKSHGTAAPRCGKASRAVACRAQHIYPYGLSVPKRSRKVLRCTSSCTAFVPGPTEHYAVAWHRQISSVNYGLSNDVTWNETNLGHTPIVVFWACMQFSKANPGLEGRQKKLLCHQPMQGSFRAAREGAEREHLTTTAIKHHLVARPGGVAGAWIFLPLC